MKQSIVLSGAAVLLAAANFGALTAGGAATRDQPAKADSLAVATFSGGCFWCVEAGFEKLPGVREAVSGYSGGDLESPTYEQVAGGGTGHTEAVQVHYAPQVISYEGLLQGLWRLADPTDAGGQFVDRGRQYRPAIFYHDQAQKAAATRSRDALAASGRYDRPVDIEIVPFERFYRAEAYHQDYYRKNPVRYQVYTFNSGRFQFQERVWGEEFEVDYSQYRPEGARYARPDPEQLRGAAFHSRARAGEGGLWQLRGAVLWRPGPGPLNRPVDTAHGTLETTTAAPSRYAWRGGGRPAG